MIGWISNANVADDFINEFVMPIVILVIIVLIAMVVTIIKSIYKYFFGNLVERLKHKELSDEELKKIDITDKESLKKELVEKFLKLKKGISTHNEEMVREVVDDNKEFFYIREIENSTKYRYEHIFMNDEVVFSSIFNFKVFENLNRLFLAVIVKRKEYIVDSDGKVLKGNKFLNKKKFYIVSFNKKINYKCPKCGAIYKSNKLSTCIKCDVKMINEDDDWKLYEVEREEFNYVNL